ARAGLRSADRAGGGHAALDPLVPRARADHLDSAAMATHLVTGGAGFLGAHTARALHARGERVRVLDILPAPELPAGIEYLRADILDAARVAEAMAGVDVVHHHAALVPLSKAGRLWRVNVDGTQQALDAARAAGVEFFIHVSTSAVFGRPAR